MKNIGKRRKKNPFRVSFLCVTIICYIVLSITFYYISYRNSKVTQEKYALEKLDLVAKDFEKQLQVMKEVAIRIAYSNEFHPYYFKEKISNELSMLETFKQYSYYIPLAEEYFLYYGDEYVYRSLGGTLNLDWFLKTKIENEEERQRLWDEIEEMKENLTNTVGETRVISIYNNDTYVLIPLGVRGSGKQDVAVLGFIVEKRSLYDRFQVVSGGMDGKMTLYGEETILYSDGMEPCVAGQKGVLTAVSRDGCYRFCYQPEMKFGMESSLFFQNLSLHLMGALLVIIISIFYSEKAYIPVKILAEMYRGMVSEKSDYHENALEELEYMMDGIVQSNREFDSQINEKQKMLRDQVLLRLIEGRISFEVMSCLDKAEICLPGPFYCIISIAFDGEEVSMEFLSGLQEEIERISDEKVREYVYTVCNLEKKVLNVICSIHIEERKEALIETICDVAESFSYEPIIGTGNMYQSLNDLSASWMESMDNVYSMKKKDKDGVQGGYIYNETEMHRIIAAMESGNEAAAIKRLDYFVKEFGNAPVSMLMLQYILSEFLCEVRQLSVKYQLEVSKQNISLLVSSRNMRDFERAVKKVIHEFCEGYENIRNQKKEGEAKRIYEYVNEHFMEYDISIENVAENMNTNADTVRQAILIYTGKLYRDYLIYRRIEYAKELLQQENFTIAEVCQQVGYGNVSYFIKIFREITGVTPAKYRKGALDKQ